LKRNHPYRRLKKAFNGYQEDKTAPPPLIGDRVYNRVSHIEVTYGKTVKHSGVKNIWMKKLIFFELPYWSKLDVRHCIVGYGLLQRKIMKEKTKSLHDSSTSEDILSLPSPPSRHEK